MASRGVTACMRGRLRLSSECPLHGPRIIFRRHASTVLTPALNAETAKALVPTMEDLVLWRWDHVTVAMSGGVDSAVTLRILAEYPLRLNVIFMRNWDPLLSENNDHDEGETSYAYSRNSESSATSPCGWQKDWDAVQKVCAHVGIPESRVRMVDLSKDYWTKVFEPSLNVWEHGGTPNPDVACNREIKFGALLRHIPKKARSFLATGHYARIKRVPHGTKLIRANDLAKDQSYYLSALSDLQLRRAIMPLAEIDKADVRRLAKFYGLPNANKEESMGLCFVGERASFSKFISQYLPEPPAQGYVVDSTGKRLVPHSGLWNYTIGQKANIAGCAEKLYIAKKGVGESGQDILAVPGGDNPALLCTELQTHDFHWIAGKTPKGFVPGGNKRVRVQIRHRMEPITAWASHEWNGTGLHIHLSEAVHGVSPGQVVTLLYKDWCLGSGIIKEAWTADERPLQDRGRLKGHYFDQTPADAAESSLGEDDEGTNDEQRVSKTVKGRVVREKEEEEDNQREEEDEREAEDFEEEASQAGEVGLQEHGSPSHVEVRGGRRQASRGSERNNGRSTQAYELSTERIEVREAVTAVDDGHEDAVTSTPNDIANVVSQKAAVTSASTTTDTEGDEHVTDRPVSIRWNPPSQELTPKEVSAAVDTLFKGSGPTVFYPPPRQGLETLDDRTNTAPPAEPVNQLVMTNNFWDSVVRPPSVIGPKLVDMKALPTRAREILSENSKTPWTEDGLRPPNPQGEPNLNEASRAAERLRRHLQWEKEEDAAPKFGLVPELARPRLARGTMVTDSAARQGSHSRIGKSDRNTNDRNDGGRYGEAMTRQQRPFGVSHSGWTGQSNEDGHSGERHARELDARRSAELSQREGISRRERWITVPRTRNQEDEDRRDSGFYAQDYSSRPTRQASSSSASDAADSSGDDFDRSLGAVDSQSSSRLPGWMRESQQGPGFGLARDETRLHRDVSTREVRAAPAYGLSNQHHAASPSPSSFLDQQRDEYPRDFDSSRPWQRRASSDSQQTIGDVDARGTSSRRSASRSFGEDFDTAGFRDERGRQGEYSGGHRDHRSLETGSTAVRRPDRNAGGDRWPDRRSRPDQRGEIPDLGYPLGRARWHVDSRDSEGRPLRVQRGSGKIDWTASDFGR